MDTQAIANHLLQQSVCMFKGRICHPEPRAIRDIIEWTRAAILPNYFDAEGGKHLSDTLDRLRAELAEQVHRATHQSCLSSGTSETQKQAWETADVYIQNLPHLQSLVYEDITETVNGDPAATGCDEVILTYPGIFALLVYRAANVLYRRGVPLLPRMMTEYAHRVTGVDLHPGATIGRSIMIDHGTGIVVGETAVVGNHVKIYQGVTLGALYFPKDEEGEYQRHVKRHPTVEDYVILYANCTVLGGETVIGHHSVIGSNAWVTQSVLPYSKVIYEAESVVRPRNARP